MTMHASAAGVGPSAEIESSYAWQRLAAALALGTIGSIGMWSFVVALPAVQANVWLLHAGGKTKVSPDTVGIPKPE